MTTDRREVIPPRMIKNVECELDGTLHMVTRTASNLATHRKQRQRTAARAPGRTTNEVFSRKYNSHAHRQFVVV